MYKYYFPYASYKPDKKFYIITRDNKKVFFGNSKYEHYTEGHLNIKRRNAYLKRHMKNEDWNNPDTSGFWSARYLWFYPTYKEAYEKIKMFLNKNLTY